MDNVTKKTLIDAITDQLALEDHRGRKGSHARKREVSRTAVKRVVQSLLDQIVRELGQGNRLELRDFGIFEVKVRAARVAQNPKTMEPVTVPARRKVRFKPGRLMKEAVEAMPGAIAGAGAGGGGPIAAGGKEPKGGGGGAGGAGSPPKIEIVTKRPRKPTSR